MDHYVCKKSGSQGLADSSGPGSQSGPAQVIPSSMGHSCRKTESRQGKQGTGSAQRLQSRAKGDVASNRAGDKVTAWVQSPSRSQVQRQDCRQAAANVQGAHQGDELPTAQVSGPSRRQDPRHPHTTALLRQGLRALK